VVGGHQASKKTQVKARLLPKGDLKKDL